MLYRTLSHFLVQIDITIPVALIMFGNASFGFNLMYIVIYMNLVSQQIQDKLKELKKALEHYAFDESQMVMIDGNFQNITKVLSLNIKNLEEFKGYDGYGYFYLGKSLLTGIMTNFMTYLIVLIQFKVSEL